MLNYEFIERSSDANSNLLILVHGRAGNLKVMRAFKSVLPANLNIIAVEAALQDPEGGYRWWEFKSGSEFSDNAKEGARQAAETFSFWLEQTLKRENISPAKIIGMGFSQGAALLSYIIQTRTEIFDAVALLAGFVIDVPDFQNNIIANKAKIFMFHGTDDPIVPFSLAKNGAEILKAKGFDFDFVSENCAHKVGIEGMKRLKSWLLDVSIARNGSE